MTVERRGLRRLRSLDLPAELSSRILGHGKGSREASVYLKVALGPSRPTGTGVAVGAPGVGGKARYVPSLFCGN